MGKVLSTFSVCASVLGSSCVRLLTPDSYERQTGFHSGHFSARKLPGTSLPTSVDIVLGHIVALYYRSSTLYQIHEHIRYLCF